MAAKQNGSDLLSALSHQIADLSETEEGIVVSLNTRGGYPTSGTIWEPGYVVTAAHVLHREDGIEITTGDGKSGSAEVVGRDPSTDLALLKADTGDIAPAPNGDPNTLRPGTLAIALSRNSERSLNTSLALINAIGGEWTTAGGGVVDHFVRLDVSAFPGFSGGPLVDTSGALIGIDSSRLSRRSPVAIPTPTVRRVVKELQERGYIRRGYLGVASFPIGLGEALRRQLAVENAGGLIVVQVEPGSGSEKAGILQGDILLDLNGRPLSDPEELQDLLGPESVGQRAGVRLVRGGTLMELDVEVGERPHRASFPRGRGRPPMHRRGPRWGR